MGAITYKYCKQLSQTGKLDFGRYYVCLLKSILRQLFKGTNSAAGIPGHTQLRKGFIPYRKTGKSLCPFQGCS